MDWYDRVEQELVDAFNAGEISHKEFRREMRELNHEIRYAAEEAAEQAREEFYQGGW